MTDSQNSFSAPQDQRHAASGQEWLDQFKHHLNGSAQACAFKSANKICGQYRSLQLRRFGRARKGADLPTLIVPPLAVHDSGFLDLSTGHSLIGALLQSGLDHVHLADWRQMTADSREQSIDTCLADLSIAIDDLGGRVNLLGLSFGGLFALLIAARFPNKVDKLLLAGTPVDMHAGLSTMTHHANKLAKTPQKLPVDMAAAETWLAPLTIAQGTEVHGLESMQRDPGSFSRADLDALALYGRWAQRKGDLSGTYIRELLLRICAGNEIAKGTFMALGKRIDLKNIHAPIFVIAGAQDEIAPRRQALRVLDLVGTPKARRRKLVVQAGHFTLFMGRNMLKREWRMAAGWLQSHAPHARPRKA